MGIDWSKYLRKESESGQGRKSAQTRGLLAPGPLQRGRGQRRGQAGPLPRELTGLGGPREPLPVKRDSPALGTPLDIRQVAQLIGCSPWTVRQTLMPRGLPCFRFKASGRLTFYEGQVVRWIESQQQGGK